MKFRILFAALPLLACSLRAVTAPVPEQIYPQLDGILKQALQQSPTMLRRALDLEIAENDRIQARANLLPTLGGSYRFQEARDERADRPETLDVTKVYYDVTLTQPLFHWGEKKNNAKMGEIRASISQEDYRNGYRLLAQTLRNDYLGLIMQKLALKRAKFYLDYSTEQLRQAEDRLSKKIISEAEIFGPRLNVEQAQIGLEQTELNFENAKRSFARLSGQPPLDDAAIPDAIPSASYSADTFSRALAGFLAQKEAPTTEAHSLRQMIRVEELNYANAKTRLRPKFNLVVGVNQDEQSYTANVADKYQVNSLYAGFQVNWTMFDGFAAGAIKRNSLARKRQMESDYRLLTERLAQDAQSQVKAIEFAARSMSIQDRMLSSAESTVNVRRDEFNRGVKSDSDVKQAQISQYDAQLVAFNTRIIYYNKVADFLGMLMEDPVLDNLPVK